jgi:hypothetical protein
MKDGHDVTPIMILKWHEDKKLTDLILKDAMLNEVPKSKYQVDRIKIDCIERKVSFSKWELYDDEKRLVWIQVTDPSEKALRNEINETSPYGVLRRVACGLTEAQK